MNGIQRTTAAWVLLLGWPALAHPLRVIFAADAKPGDVSPGMVIAVVSTEAVLKESKKFGPRLAELLVQEKNIRTESLLEAKEMAEGLRKLRKGEKKGDEAEELDRKVQELNQASQKRGETSKRIELERRDIHVQFMEEFRAAIKTISTRQGIDLVIRKEGAIGVTAVLEREILFSSERADITASVLKLMNAEAEAK